MKKGMALGISVLLGIVALWILAPWGYGAEPSSFTLVCRGGGSMRAVYGPRRSGGSDLWIYFEKASSGATQRQPGAGECAWVDRALRETEPAKLLFTGDDQYISRLDITGTSKFRIVGVQGNDLKYLLEAVTSGDLFYVRCRNTRQELTSTRVGP